MRKLPILPAALAAALLVAAGCTAGNGDSEMPVVADDTAPATTPNDNVSPAASNVPADADIAGDHVGASASNPLTVATAQGIEGTFLVDSAGTSLYFLEDDNDGSRCVDECADIWPPFLVEAAMPSESPGLDAAMVGVVTRPDGTIQVSYNGHPLYRYAADSGIGSTAGHGVEDQWGHWYLLTPAGTEVEVSGSAPE